MSNVPFAAQMEELAAFFASKISVPTIGIGGGYAPIGTIISYMGTTAPQDYLACDGSTKNIADYPHLAEFFAAQFGSANFFGGNGTTTFAVPDLRGEFLRGTGTNGHTDQGDGGTVGEHQDATWHTRSMSGSVVGMNGAGAITTVNDDYTKTSVTRLIVPPSSNDTAGTIFASRPTNTSILYCIKAVVAGEVYSTDEREGGTWIDGRKWYYKTFNCGSMPNNTVKLISAGIGVNVVDNVISMEGAIKGGSGGFQAYNLPTVRNDGTDIVVRYVSSTDKIELITTDNWSGYSGYITMKYQKTT